MREYEDMIREYKEIIDEYFKSINILIKKGIKIDGDLCFNIYGVEEIEPPKDGFNLKEYIILLKYKIFFLKKFLDISDKKQREIVNELGYTQEYYFKSSVKLIPYVGIETFNKFRVLP